MSRIVYKGRIDGEFEGFDDEALFRMMDGSYWIQAQYKYWYHYTFNPEAIITEEHGQYILTVAENSIPVRQIQDVIESRIEGEFEGWEGESIYKLTNGQVWKQSRYKYEYRYAYRPEALIYHTSYGYKMKVAGTITDVERVK